MAYLTHNNSFWHEAIAMENKLSAEEKDLSQKYISIPKSAKLFFPKEYETTISKPGYVSFCQTSLQAPLLLILETRYLKFRYCILKILGKTGILVFRYISIYCICLMLLYMSKRLTDIKESNRSIPHYKIYNRRKPFRGLFL